MTIWHPTNTGLGRSDGCGAIIDLSLVGAGQGYIPRPRLADGQLHSLKVRPTLGSAQAAVVRFFATEPEELPVSERPAQPKETSMSEMAALVAQVTALTEQVAKLTNTGPPAARREKQAAVVAEKRQAIWINLGAPNGYIHPSGRAKVEWDGRRWFATVDGVRNRKMYRKSFNARVAAGLKLSAAMKAA